ncbi:MAG: TIGR02921 family PEP-CTERM protein, partial [Cyanobacteria bacterium J06639_1]
TGHSLLLGIGLYGSSLLAFYAIPSVVRVAEFTAALVVEFFEFRWIEALWRYPFGVVMGGLALILFSLSGAVFVAMPFVMLGAFFRDSVRGLKQFGRQFGSQWAIAGTSGLLALWIAAFAVLQVQPQARAFELLETPTTTPANRQALVAKSDVIREGLLNAYLNSYRYLSPREANNHVFAMYRHLNVPEAIANRLQDANNALLSPFLYHGDRGDDARAAELYAQFFDTSIQKAERRPIQDALRATYNRSGAAAGQLDANRETVWLAQQDVTVNSHGDWADVEIHEKYVNQTPDRQEAFYSFSLPESAVLTGLWLGESEDLDQRFTHVISPRGAAQQVYRDQVRQQVDPALLEQVGPRQYRLRAFPILERPSIGKTQPMHLWMTYQTMQEDGAWPLPRLSERRNVYWTRFTKRTQNGRKVARVDDWFPEAIPAANAAEPQIHSVTLPEGYAIALEPISTRGYQRPANQRLAVVLDTSRSMGDRQSELAETSRLLDEALRDGNAIDLYRTGAAGIQSQLESNFQTLDSRTIEFYGSLSLPDLLQQFQTLRGDRAYDAILVVTDAGSYDLATEDAEVVVPDAPLWLVHLDGLPSTYDDATLAAIQDSNGGIAHTVREALDRWATEVSLRPNVASIIDGYIWYADPVQNAPAEVAGDRDFAPLAARQAIWQMSRAGAADGDTSLLDLDAIHAIAKRYDIVTPYSSAIVLVNDAQREALKRAEEQDDRFDREVETGVETLTQPDNPLAVNGVPEPEEWILMGLGAIALAGATWRKRRQMGGNEA